MEVHCSPWQSMAVHGSSWQSMAVHGSSWQFMAVHGSPWQSMAVHDSPWQSMTVHGSPWQSMAFHGSSWQSMAVHGSPWQCEAVCPCAGGWGVTVPVVAEDWRLQAVAALMTVAWQLHLTLTLPVHGQTAARAQLPGAGEEPHHIGDSLYSIT